MHPINEFGTDAQKEKYIPRLGWCFISYFSELPNTSISISQGRDHRRFCTLHSLSTALLSRI